MATYWKPIIHIWQFAIFFRQNLADLGHCFVIKNENKVHVEIRFSGRIIAKFCIEKPTLMKMEVIH